MLSIGDITVDVPLVLAPMSGISDLPYRRINRSLGFQLAFTEMISSHALAYSSPNTLKMLSTDEGDSPLGIQLVGEDPDILKRAIDAIHGHSFDLVDFNCACPVKKVAGKGRGAGLLKEPAKLQMLLRVIVEHAQVPATVKIRSGWDDQSVNAVEVGQRAEDAGARAVFIHGRTRLQAYSGTVDYQVIEKLKNSVSIPIIASGDGLSPGLIMKMFRETGCDGVAVARGALGNPWIHRETHALMSSGEMLPRPTPAEIADIMRKHLAMAVPLYGERFGVIQFRKFFAWYTKGLPVKELKRKAFRTDSFDAMTALISHIASLPSPSPPMLPYGS